MKEVWIIGGGLAGSEAAWQAAERGAEVGDVVRAFRIACEVTGADALWETIEELVRTGGFGPNRPRYTAFIASKSRRSCR